jgi:ATP-dependent Clp protease adaptor protein ClpS
MGGVCHHGPVSAPSPMEVEPDVEQDVTPEGVTVPSTPWVTIVWNDPVNLMSYVTYVFQKHFGYAKKKAEKLMMEVHEDGRSVVSSGTREEMERDVQAMHEYGLWATLQKQE